MIIVLQDRKCNLASSPLALVLFSSFHLLILLPFFDFGAPETESESTATKATLEEFELSLIAELGLKHSYWKTPSQLAEVVVPSS